MMMRVENWVDLLIDRQVEDTVGLWQEPRPLPHFAYVCIYTQAAHVQTYTHAHIQYTYIHKFPQKQPELTDSPESPGKSPDPQDSTYSPYSYESPNSPHARWSDTDVRVVIYFWVSHSCIMCFWCSLDQELLEKVCRDLKLALHEMAQKCKISHLSKKKLVQLFSSKPTLSHKSRAKPQPANSHSLLQKNSNYPHFKKEMPAIGQFPFAPCPRSPSLVLEKYSTSF